MWRIYLLEEHIDGESHGLEVLCEVSKGVLLADGVLTLTRTVSEALLQFAGWGGVGEVERQGAEVLGTAISVTHK